jgi:hypothetical protein
VNANDDRLRQALAEHIAGAYVSGNDDQVRQARLLERALDGIGLNVDNAVDRLVLEQARSLPSERGHGGLLPHLPPF